jgi:hypothetical protein
VWFNRLTYAGVGLAAGGLILDQVLYDGVFSLARTDPLRRTLYLTHDTPRLVHE